MKWRTVVLSLAVLVTICNTKVVYAQTPTLKISLPSLSMFTIIYHLAQDKGFFEREGVNIEINHFEAGAISMRALIARAVDIADVETGLILGAVANGAGDLRVIGTHSHRLHFALYAKKDIVKLDQLYGRTFAIAGPGGLTHLVILALLDKQGLDVNRLQLLPVGGTGARLSSLAAGKVDATLGEYSPVIEAQPSLHRMMIVSPELPLYMAQGLVVWNDTLTTKREAILRFQRALVKATRWAYDNKAEMTEAARKHLPANAVDLDKIYDFYRLARVWAINGEVDIDSLTYMQELGLKTKTQSAKVDIEKLVDDNFYRSTMKVLGSRSYPQ